MKNVSLNVVGVGDAEAVARLPGVSVFIGKPRSSRAPDVQSGG